MIENTWNTDKEWWSIMEAWNHISVLDEEAVLTQRVKYGGLEEKLLKIDIVWQHVEKDTHVKLLL